jgi:hypothetical protein
MSGGIVFLAVLVVGVDREALRKWCEAGTSRAGMPSNAGCDAPACLD